MVTEFVSSLRQEPVMVEFLATIAPLQGIPNK
jgi:hypothetical protein